MSLFAEDRTRHLLSYSPVVIYACCVDGDYDLTYVSENVTEHYGYSVRECLNSKNFWREIVHPDDLAHVMDSCDQLLSAGHEAHEYRFRKKDGSYVWVRDEMRLVRDEDGNPVEVVGSWSDISTRHSTEEALDKSETLFRAFFDSNPIPTIITSPAGDIFLVNPAFTQVTGYSPEDVVGKTAQEMGFWKNMADRERMVSAIHATGAIDNLEANFYGKDNKPMTCIVSSRAVEHGGEIRMLSTIIDVTDQRMAEDARRRAEKLFSVFFHDNPVAAIISTTDGVVKEVNAAFLSNSGFDRKDVEGHSAQELFWTRLEDRDRVLAALNKQGYVDKQEIVFYDKDRNPRVCHLSCRIIQVEGEPRILNLIDDVTEKRNAEVDRRKSDNLFRSLFETSPVGAIVTSPEGKIYLANPAFTAASGYTSEELVGKTVHELGFWQKEEDRNRMVEAIQTQGYIDNLEAVFFGKGREEITCQVSSRAIDFGTETKILNIVVDVTEQRMAEEAMIKLDKAKSDFISTVAHELRTPLIAVVGYCELLENAAEMSLTEHQQHEYLEVVRSNAEVLNLLVDDLLDIGRIQIGRSLGVSLKETALLPLIEKVVASSRLKSARHEIVIEHDESLPQKIWADPGRISQVFNNLLSNAIKFSPAAAIIKIRLACSDSTLRASVVDQGIGMTAEQVEHIFDRFYRVDIESTETRGLGLGLSIVKQIISDHHGDIHVSSSPGEGTSVTFTLPISDISSKN